MTAAKAPVLNSPQAGISQFSFWKKPSHFPSSLASSHLFASLPLLLSAPCQHERWSNLDGALGLPVPLLNHLGEAGFASIGCKSPSVPGPRSSVPPAQHAQKRERSNRALLLQRASKINLTNGYNTPVVMIRKYFLIWNKNWILEFHCTPGFPAFQPRKAAQVSREYLPVIQSCFQRAASMTDKWKLLSLTGKDTGW